MEKKLEREPLPSVAIVGKLGAATRAGLERELGKSLMAGSRDLDIWIVDGGRVDPKLFHSEVAHAVKDKAVVLPIMRDSEGHRLIPTGVLQVRFKSKLSAPELTAFAKRHGFKVVNQNRWSPMQASFTIEPGESRFLTEIVSKLASDKIVNTAWPDVQAAFRREST